MQARSAPQFNYWALALLLLGTGGAPAAEYVVGPGKALTEIEEVPWETLQAGDVVSIHARSEPYRSKWVICQRGTEAQPIIVRGIPSPEGQLAVIDGRDAVTRQALNYWGEERGVIKIGGANRPADAMPAHIVIENLDIRSARPPYFFNGRSGQRPYLQNAASIFIEKGEHITVRGCILHDSGNGFFTAPATRNILVEHCWIHDNGGKGSIYEHNNYTSSDGITFQFNRFGPLREGCLGNNLKDRSAGLVVRYNWIEGGNRTLDLVDGAFVDHPGYRKTFVYGNLLIKLNDHGNNQVVHYGGDSGQIQGYRKGTLYFMHNTVISLRSGTTVLFRLSSDQERVECHNNIFFAAAPGRQLALLTGTGQADLFNNWIRAQWQPSHTAMRGIIRTHGNTLQGETPGFVAVDDRDFRLTHDSPCIGAGGELPEAALPHHRLKYQYVPHQQRADRSGDSRQDLGAFEFSVND
jgi:hypothetical protein